MKKLVLVAVAFVFLFVIVGTATAAKPAGNLAGAQTYAWHLSGAVMPVPPYGSGDIPGSDTASKLIVNQPNGNTEVAITGVMNGLNPNTTYTVYLANGYTPPVFTGWNVTGSYVINVRWLDVDYPETLILTQNGTNITGVSLDTIPPASYFVVYNGSVIGNVINIYANKGSLVVHMSGTIAADGSMSGSWADEAPGIRTGTWATTSGVAAKTYTGDAGFTGLFNTQLPFTFTTDASGAGSWHLNLKDEDLTGPDTYDLSVWINGGGATILVSDNFNVVVD